MKIESQKLNITEAFKDFYYEVPDYQREYVWKEMHVTQLFSDIYDEFTKDQNSEYFIGSIVVNKPEDETRYEVIDGQQRLTTLFLSLCAFRHRFSKDPELSGIIQALLQSPSISAQGEVVRTPHLVLQYAESSQVLNDILDGKKRAVNLGAVEQNIWDAFETISEYISGNFESEAELKKFYGYFSRKVNFVQIETPSISDALKIFETINERGVGLNPMDLLKNLIFRQLPREQFAEVNANWKKIVATLAQNEQKPLRFLRYFLMANYKISDTNDPDVLREDEIYDWIIKHDEVCQYKARPLDFASKLQGGATAYVQFSKGQKLDGTASFALENIVSLGGRAFSQHLVLLLASKDLHPTLFDHLVRQIEVLVFYYFITRTPAKTLETKFSRWADLLRGVAAGDDQQEGLEAIVLGEFSKEISQLAKTYEQQFKYLTLNSLQRYKIRYILAKLSQYVDSARLGNKTTGSLSPYIQKGVEIEHILPETPTAELLQDFGAEIYDDNKIRLGNLALLEKPINIVAGRDFFEKKKPLYAKSSYYLTKSLAHLDEVGSNTSVTRINEKLKAFDGWSAQDIEVRQQMLYELALDVWHLSEPPPVSAAAVSASPVVTGGGRNMADEGSTEKGEVAPGETEESSIRTAQERIAELPADVRAVYEQGFLDKVLAWADVGPGKKFKKYAVFNRGDDPFLWVRPQATQLRVYTLLTPDEAGSEKYRPADDGSGYFILKKEEDLAEALRLAKLSYDKRVWPE